MSAHASEDVVRVAEMFATLARTLAEHRDDVQLWPLESEEIRV